MKNEKLFLLSALALVLLAGCVQQQAGNQLPQGNELEQGAGTGMPFGGNPAGAEQYGGPQGNEGISAQPGSNQPLQNSGQQSSEFNFPPIDSNAALPSLPDDFPESKFVSTKFKDIEINYFSTAIARAMTESGTDFFINLKNTGTSKQSLCFSEMTDEFRKQIPSWNLHFFFMQDSLTELNPGEEKELWVYASVDQPGYFNVKFILGECGSEAESIEIPVVFGSSDESFWGKETTFIYGTVNDSEGNPVKDAMVFAVMNCGRMDFKEKTDAQGKFVIKVFGKEDIDAVYLGKKLACDSTDYFVSVEQEGYEYFYSGNVVASRENPARLGIVLEKEGEKRNYLLAWEKQIEGNFGFFWVKPSNDWSVFAATQAKHPPELNKEGFFTLLDSEGKVLWAQATGNECWGIDISEDGSKVIAGCHDEKVYAVDRTGNLLWETSFNSMVRTACISANNSKVLSGDMPALIDASSGAKQELEWTGDWLRNCAFYRDNSGFVAGARELTGFDFSGNQKWVNVIGEFPLFLSVDGEKNTFATGKSRTFFSFDSEGKLRWKHRIPEHTATAGASTPDGSRIALGTVGGMVYFFDGEGNLLWKRGTGKFPSGGSAGHNAVAISDDGKIVVVGTAPQNCIMAYNEKGTIIWEKCLEADESNKDLLAGVTNVQISPDKKQIIASYGDNYIRKFAVEE